MASKNRHEGRVIREVEQAEAVVLQAAFVALAEAVELTHQAVLTAPNFP
ncbi:hypothetical protein GIW57_05375 [Stenotrophomonas sp. PA-6-5C]|nr:hypothetical protein [Stenotrophomonas sp. PA-6-5C]